MKDNSNEQYLIDICFGIATTMHTYYPSTFKHMSQQELCEWVANQLKICGFETSPMGASWGVLTKINRS